MEEVLGILVHANVGMSMSFHSCRILYHYGVHSSHEGYADQITSASSVVAMKPEEMLNLAEMLQKAKGEPTPFRAG